MVSAARLATRWLPPKTKYDTFKLSITEPGNDQKERKKKFETSSMDGGMYVVV
jgi:hypothetical protein